MSPLKSELTACRSASGRFVSSTTDTLILAGMNAVGILVGTFLLTGCAATSGSSTDPQLARFDKETSEATIREQKCEKQAEAEAADDLSRRIFGLTGSA
jgi:hypothetical protein